jgi:hypothetical protein
MTAKETRPCRWRTRLPWDLNRRTLSWIPPRSLRCTKGGMTTPSSHSSGGDAWLHQYLLDAVSMHLCTKIHCTTCGAREFRDGLMVALANKSDRSRVALFDLDTARMTATGLTRVVPTEGRSAELEQAIRLILFEIWRTIGAELAEREVEPILVGTWCGAVLAHMKAHHRAREEARHAFAESQAAALIQQRRDEKQRIRQKKHAERLLRKKESDRLWHQAHGSSNS